MSLRQRKEIMLHEGGGPAVTCGVMALVAIGGEAGGDVVRLPGRRVLVPVTIDALIADPLERQGVLRNVTIHTTGREMRTKERESVLFVQFRDIIHQPGLLRMAACTIVAHRHGMHIRVARHTIRRRFHIEIQGYVTGPAIDRDVLSGQGKSRSAMVELQRVAQDVPGLRHVAGRTIDCERRAMR